MTLNLHSYNWVMMLAMEESNAAENFDNMQGLDSHMVVRYRYTLWGGSCHCWGSAKAIGVE